MTARQHMWEFECDRCGKAVTTSEYAPPEGWGHHVQVGDLCPGCVANDWVEVAERYLALLGELEELTQRTDNYQSISTDEVRDLVEEERQEMATGEDPHHDRDS